MLDQTLTQLLNELYSLTAKLQNAAQIIETKDARIAELEKQADGDNPSNNAD